MAHFKPLGGFGIEAEGVDLSQPLTDGHFRELEHSFYANHVLALHEQASDRRNSPRSRAALVHRSRTCSGPVPSSRGSETS